MGDSDLIIPENFQGIFIGGSIQLEMLYAHLNQLGKGRFWYVYSGLEVLDIASHNEIHAVIIEPRSFGGSDPTALLAFQLRTMYPEIAVALFISDKEFDEIFFNSSPSVKHRLSHYFRLRRVEDAQYSYLNVPEPNHLSKILFDCLQWHNSHIKEVGREPKYKYDVAISFAGEDREFAKELAEILRNSGVRVFYDSFEQADLWGKNLFEHLYYIYSSASRFCIILVSESYVKKRWTIHERRSAQERVLNERQKEYLLPVRIDSSPLPGLPSTIDYVEATKGPYEIAQLFIRKLGNVLCEEKS